MNLSPSPHFLTAARRRLFVFVKLASICALILLLHVPLAMTRGVLIERQGYQNAAKEEIASTWGREQILAGPVLAVPYVYRTTVARSKVVNAQVIAVQEAGLVSATAYFLPEVLKVEGTLAPEIRRRGIYDVVVYTAHLKLAGHFRPDLVAAGMEAERVDWGKARVYWGVSDLRGLRTLSALKTSEGREVVFESAEPNTGAYLTLGARVEGVAAATEFPFTLDAVVQGSGRFDVAPVGKVTTVTIDAPWPDPSFTGASLPVARSVTAEGFRAEWQSLHFSRGFPQSWSDRNVERGEIDGKLAAGSFGVRFAQPVDGYSMVERARKYGVLFFVLIFTVFFLFEVVTGLRIHPLQYALAGVALSLFFIGFLALSEFWPVGWAYGASAAACSAMVALYARSFLRAGRRSLLIGGGLGATYGYLYFVLKSQDYALIAGTVALFVAVGLVMFCTRRINWYAVDQPEGIASEPKP